MKNHLLEYYMTIQGHHQTAEESQAGRRVKAVLLRMCIVVRHWCIDIADEAGFNGYFISRDPEDIAKKIQLLLSNSEKLRTLSLNARRAAESYSWYQISESVLCVYQEVLDVKRI
jgi:glycosyltransferase involved in cell wall biosynthesis